ncbi:MAG: hypothetical protein EYC62_03800 [Alphaproteobacteria bacterium]|nr:MAG: hypothetical protein EYC62_03800 [Alphaproteobacteria bacterium]
MNMPETARTAFDDFADFVTQVSLLKTQSDFLYALADAYETAMESENTRELETPQYIASINASCERLYGARRGKKIAAQIIAGDKSEYTENELRAKLPWKPPISLRWPWKWPKFMAAEPAALANRQPIYLSSLLRNIKKLKQPIQIQNPSPYVITQLARWKDQEGKLSKRISDIFHHHWQNIVGPMKEPELAAYFQGETPLCEVSVSRALRKFDEIQAVRIPELCERVSKSPAEHVDQSYFTHVYERVRDLGYTNLTAILQAWFKPSTAVMSNMATNPGRMPPGNNDSTGLNIYTPTGKKPTPAPPTVPPGHLR